MNKKIKLGMFVIFFAWVGASLASMLWIFSTVLIDGSILIGEENLAILITEFSLSICGLLLFFPCFIDGAKKNIIEILNRANLKIEYSRTLEPEIYETEKVH